jgi:hypothetical protein
MINNGLPPPASEPVAHLRAPARETPIDRLRALAAALRAGEAVPPDVARWAVEAIRQYEDDAAAGLTLDRTFGLVPARGELPWWRREALQRRNAILQQLHQAFFGELAVSVAAMEIARLFARRVRRRGTDLGGFDGRDALVDAALATGLGALSASRIETILPCLIGDSTGSFSRGSSGGTISQDGGSANDGDQTN